MKADSYTDDSLNGTDLVGVVQGLDNNVQIVCRSTEFLVRHVITPAAEATIQAYIQNCTSEFDPYLPDRWFLCSDGDEFNCDPIHKYVQQCKTNSNKQRLICGAECPVSLAQAMSEPSVVLLLVGLLVTGIILGVLSTVIVCLMCPTTYKWATDKLQCFGFATKVQEPLQCGYYAADRQARNNLQARELTEKGASSQSNKHSDFGDPTYLDSDFHNNSSASIFAGNPGIPSGTSQESPYANTAEPSHTYETLDNGTENMRQKSHKYSKIDPISPISTASDTDHSYFVLEKT